MEKGRFYQYDSGEYYTLMEWKIWSEYFKQYIDVHMDCEEENEEKNLDIFYENLNSLNEDTYENIAQAVVKMYQEERAEMDEIFNKANDKTAFEDDFIFKMPKEINPLEIFEYLSDFALYVVEPKNDNSVVMLSCNMEWEIEHGLDICIVNGAVVYVTYSGGMIDAYSDEEIDFYRDKDYNYARFIK